MTLGQAQERRTKQGFLRPVCDFWSLISILILWILARGEEIGQMEYGAGLYRFWYAEKYGGPELPGLKRDEINELNELFAVFENLIPEYDQKDFAQWLARLFDKIGEVLGTPEAKLEALRFYFYGYLIKHADLHLKNIGALNIGQNKYILAPLYDVISVGIYRDDCDDLGFGFENPAKKPKNWRFEDFQRRSAGFYRTYAGVH